MNVVFFKSAPVSAINHGQRPSSVHPDIRNKYFWGGKLWTNSYFVETIGNATEEVIRKYVQDQLKTMDKEEKTGWPLALF
ncbi:MAG: transposase [Pseudomonadales bacterium]